MLLLEEKYMTVILIGAHRGQYSPLEIHFLFRFNTYPLHDISHKVKNGHTSINR